MIYLIIFAVSLLVSALLARLVRDVANARGWATAPQSARHLHQKPVPRLGGIAILGTVILVVTIAAIASNLLHLGYSFPSRHVPRITRTDLGDLWSGAGR